MRAVELVGRAEEEVDVHGDHVEREVGRGVDRVDQQPGADGARELPRQGDVVDRPQGVRGVADGDQAGFRGDLAREIFRVEPAVGPEGHLADLDPPLAQMEPGAAVGLVVELGDDDLVPRPHLAHEGMREGEVQTRHVGPEGDLPGARSPQERRRRRPRRVDDHIRFARGDELAVSVGIRAPVIAGDRLDHRIRNLGPRRTVEESERPAVPDPGESGEVLAGALAVGFGERGYGGGQGFSSELGYYERAVEICCRRTGTLWITASQTIS